MQAACLARCNGVELHRSKTFSLEAFRSAVRDTSTSETEHLIASYSRKEFLQTGEASTADCSVLSHVRPGILLEGVCHGSTPAVPAGRAGLLMALFCRAGDGHFSPLGGYHEDKDMVLILDTARFKYPSVSPLKDFPVLNLQYISVNTYQFCTPSTVEQAGLMCNEST